MNKSRFGDMLLTELISFWGLPNTPFSLPIPNILCQTFRMKNLTATICLTIAVLLGVACVGRGNDTGS